MASPAHGVGQAVGIHTCLEWLHSQTRQQETLGFPWHQQQRKQTATFGDPGPRWPPAGFVSSVIQDGTHTHHPHTTHTHTPHTPHTHTPHTHTTHTHTPHTHTTQTHTPHTTHHTPHTTHHTPHTTHTQKKKKKKKEHAHKQKHNSQQQRTKTHNTHPYLV